MTAEQQKLVEENHNLIYSYLHKHKLPIDEFYSVAAIGLCEAAVKYDGDVSKFSTYAFLCMDSRVKNAINFKRTQKSIPNNSCVSIHTLLFDAEGSRELCLEDVIPDGSTMEDDVEVELIFEKFLAGLNERDRMILDMSSRGIPQKDIGAELGMARNTVCYHMKCMLRDLRKMLEGIE